MQLVAEESAASAACFPFPIESSRILVSDIPIMASTEIHLDGSEISIIKAIGLSGGGMLGEVLLEKLPELIPAELSDTLTGLIAMGYLDCDRGTLHSTEELQKAHFNVNSGYAHELKAAINPKPEQKKSRRVRRE